MKAFKGILGTLAFFAILCLAGTADRTSEIIYTMPGETYEEIKCKLTGRLRSTMLKITKQWQEIRVYSKR